MANQHKENLETSNASMFTLKNDASHIQPQARRPEASKKPESSSQKFRPEEQAQIPKKSTTDSILNANKWMRREENIYKGLLDLKPDMETMRLDDNRPKNKHLKHEANKVLVGHREASKKEVERKKVEDEKRKGEERKKQKKDEDRAQRKEEAKTKLAEIQTTKKKKQETLASLSEQVESVVTRSKVAEHQEVDRVDVMVEEFSREIEGMSPLGPRPRPEEKGLTNIEFPKKSKSKRKAGTSRPKDIQRGNKMSAQKLDKLIKIEKGLLPFNDPLLNFLYGLIKTMKLEKFFIEETKVKLDIVDMFYVAKFHLNESYMIVEGEKVSFTVEEINELYDLPNDRDTGMVGGKSNLADLNRIRTLYQNKEEERHLKTEPSRNENDEEDDISPPPSSFKRKSTTAMTPRIFTSLLHLTLIIATLLLQNSQPLKALLRNDNLWDVSIEKAVDKVEIVDPKLHLTVYDALFQDIPVEEDVGETSSEEEAPLEEEEKLKKEAPVEKEVDLCNVLC
ncbi:stress response protein NST1-like [Cucumis melo var. makuwa]|uniref:Stress response protein NST1-like n=1 Tax=Cucumis melo var. makuwa TaxID=1194695 RepID=A0A5A7TBU7_CUCMM|nr:stress response protein NST1-like [Cucumis melo var. makuwa]